MRGGSWNNDNAQNFRASNRNNNDPSNRNNNNGFRCAQSSPSPERAAATRGRSLPGGPYRSPSGGRQSLPGVESAHL